MGETRIDRTIASTGEEQNTLIASVLVSEANIVESKGRASDGGAIRGRQDNLLAPNNALIAAAVPVLLSSRPWYAHNMPQILTQTTEVLIWKTHPVSSSSKDET